MTKAWLLAIAMLLLGALCGGTMVSTARPEPSWTTEAKLVRVVDGDTVVVEIRRTFRVRLLDCWTPESRTRDLTEKAKGLAAKAYLKSLVSPGDPLRVTVPTTVEGDWTDVWTMGRVLGYAWPEQGEDLSTQLVKAGHATRTKKEQRP